MEQQLQFYQANQLDAAQYRVQMGIDDEEMERRASFVGIDEADHATMRRVRDVVEAHAEEAAQAFVDLLVEASDRLRRTPAAAQEGHRRMVTQLRTMVRSSYDSEYAIERIEAALFYARHGIEPKIFSAGFQRALNALGTHLRTESPDDVLEAVNALQKVGLMDLALTLDVLFWDRARALQNYQATVMELSTPVQQVWDGILLAPIIGTLDTARAQQVMERLLQAIEIHEAAFVIVDISGVPTVDTSVAQNLLKTIHAARLMGTKTILSGVRPEIASTMVHFGVDLGKVETQRTMREALRIAIGRLGRTPRLEPVAPANHGAVELVSAGPSE